MNNQRELDRVELSLAILLAADAFLCFAGCKEKPRAAAPTPTVEVTLVTQADVPIYHDWIGTLDGLVNATIRAQVTGYLLTQDYREGDAIKKGDLLINHPQSKLCGIPSSLGTGLWGEASFAELDREKTC
jgi:multidrug efflux pump subunit AcrA (membrane-fusion protein)